jgi:hypothetical protein
MAQTPSMLNELIGGITIATTVIAIETGATMEIATMEIGTVTDIGTTVTATVGADMVPARMLADFSTRRGEITGRATPQPLMT